MMIDAVLLIAFVAGLLFGGSVAWFLSSRYYRTAWLQAALRAKNPEIWDLAHFVLQEEETGKHERRGPRGRPPEKG